MMQRRTFGARFVGAAVVGGAAMALAACSAEVVPIDGGNGAGGSGGSTSTGGMGGAAGGSGGAFTGPCGTDCSLIAAPACFQSVCNEGQHQGPVNSCVVVPSEAGGACDDAQFCTVGDACDGAGVCVGGPENDCGMQPAECQAVVCNEAAKSCAEQPIPNDAACASTDLCLVNTTCQNGLCIGMAKDCFFAPVPNECHVAVCNPANGICEPETGNEGMSCVDPNDLCTDGKTCSAGTCVGGGPKDCSALTMECVEGVCDATSGQCVTQPLMPGQNCSAATDDCNQGICDMQGICQATPINQGGACESAAADDCNQGICDMQGICQATPTNQGGACEDGSPCTGGETCNAGVCQGGTMIPKTTYFSDDFSDNAAGWTLDTEWQIGAAMVSSGQSGGCTNPDPGSDHTATSDNGLAGVVIGGNASTIVHPAYFLTSPAVDTSSVVGPLWLGYWRWLNSDYPTFMTNRVQVFNGATWVDVWVQPSNSTPITDAAWNQHAYDVSAHKNPQFRIRFGFEVGSTIAYTCSSWNLDDVELANVICP